MSQLLAPGETLVARSIVSGEAGEGRLVLEVQAHDGAFYKLDLALTDLLYWVRYGFLREVDLRTARIAAAADAVQRQHDLAYTARAEAAFEKMERAAAASIEDPA